MKDITPAFIELLTNGWDIAKSLSEDNVLQDINLADVLAVYNSSNAIKEYFFAKKLKAFLFETKSIPAELKITMIIEIDNSHQSRTKVGEKLLIEIENASDIEKAAWIGQLFARLLENKITYIQFLNCLDIIRKTDLATLLEHIKGDFTTIFVEDKGEYIYNGLFIITSPKIELEAQTQIVDAFQKKSIGGADYKIKEVVWTAKISETGEILRKYLKEL